MGMGYSYKCKKCGHEYSVFLGVGMMYPQVYRQKLDEIAEGAYGKEWMILFHKTPYAAINAEKIIYICSSCSRWETATVQQTLRSTHLMILKAFRKKSMG